MRRPWKTPFGSKTFQVDNAEEVELFETEKGRIIAIKKFHLISCPYSQSQRTRAPEMAKLRARKRRHPLHNAIFFLSTSSYNDYDHHDDDTSCHLLENIKFKLNYMPNYWEYEKNGELKASEHNKMWRSTIIWQRHKGKKAYTSIWWGDSVGVDS